MFSASLIPLKYSIALNKKNVPISFIPVPIITKSIKIIVRQIPKANKRLEKILVKKAIMEKIIIFMPIG